MSCSRWRCSPRCDGERGRRARRKQLFAFSILYLFLLFAVLLVEARWPRCSARCWHERWRDKRMNEQKPRRHRAHRGAEARRRARSIAIALSLGVLVVLFYIVTLVKGPACCTGRCETSRCDEPRRSPGPPPPPRPRGRRRLRRFRRRDGRRGLRGGAALQLVLPHHRLRRHPAGRDGGARRRCSTARSRCASTPTSRPGCRGASRRSRLESRSSSARSSPSTTRSSTRPRARPSGRPAYNVAPPTAGIYFSKINCFCFTEQTHEAGREARDGGRVLCRSRAGAGSRAGRPQHHHAVLHLLSGAPAPSRQRTRRKAGGGAERGRP